MNSEERLITTYLEMRDVVASRGQRSQVTDHRFQIREMTERDWKFNRDMYFKVGENWRWIDKRPWTDEQWEKYAADPNLRTFAGYFSGEVAGYFELNRGATSSPRCHQSAITGQSEIAEIEIAYFGLLPEFIGRGLGGALLTAAIENAWAWLPTPSRVWVHTCNRDHPNALVNYLARGFEIYKSE